MAKFQRKSKEEIHQLSVDEFCDYMSDWDKATDGKWHEQELTELDMPTFSSKEEARKHYGAISFDEFEQKYLLK